MAEKPAFSSRILQRLTTLVKRIVLAPPADDLVHHPVQRSVIFFASFIDDDLLHWVLPG